MKEDDRFDFGPYPDFMGMAMPFSDDLFEEEEELVLEDGIMIGRSYLCETWCYFRKWLCLSSLVVSAPWLPFKQPWRMMRV